MNRTETTTAAATIETAKLNNGQTVAARNGRPTAYVNYTQAEGRAAALRQSGVACRVRGYRRPFYVLIEG